MSNKGESIPRQSLVYTMHVTTADHKASARIEASAVPLIERFEAYLIAIGAEWDNSTKEYTLPEVFNFEE